jgi:hypothetical protein
MAIDAPRARSSNYPPLETSAAAREPVAPKLPFHARPGDVAVPRAAGLPPSAAAAAGATGAPPHPSAAAAAAPKGAVVHPSAAAGARAAGGRLDAVVAPTAAAAAAAAAGARAAAPQSASLEVGPACQPLRG